MLRAVGGSVAVLVIPGAVVAYGLRASFRRLTTWAVVPAFSLAVVFIGGELINLVRLPFNGYTLGTLVLLGAGAAVGRRLLTSDRATDPPVPMRTETAAGEHNHQTIALLLLFAAMALSIAVFAHGIGRHDLVPPEIDASNHGFFVARIVQSGSLNLDKVVVTDPDATYRVASFYPLAMHASAATATEIGHADIGQVLLAFDVIFAAVVLPLGMFSLTRMLAPELPLAAGFSAVAAVVLTLFPYAATGYGDVPLVVGMSLVPISVVVLVYALTAEHRSRSAAIASLIAATLVAFSAIAVHSSQVPLIAVLVGVLLLELAWRRASRVTLLKVLERVAIVGAAALLLFGASVTRLASGVSERSGVTLTGRTSTSSALRQLVTLQPPTSSDRQILLALLVLAGIVVCAFRCRPAWIVGYAIVLGVTLLVWVHGPLSGLLGAPWYHSSARLDFNQIFFVAFFAGLALAFAVTRLAAVRNIGVWTASVMVVLVFVLAIGVSGSRTSSRTLHRAFRANARVTDSSLAAFTWLRDHARKDDVIVNDENADGSIWMYAFERLHPLFSIKPLFSDSAAYADWSQRAYLLNHLGGVGDNHEADAIARRYGARWVYYDESVFDLFRHNVELSALMANTHLQLAFKSGTVYVFRLSGI